MSRKTLQSTATSAVTEKAISEPCDWIWGAAAIGEEIDRTAAQVRYLFSTGFFGDAVWKAGHRTLVGSRQRLQSLPSARA